MTIYNNQFAMVKDVRKIAFTQGRSDLYFTDVSSNIQTETVTFKALQDTDNVRVFEQNYEANTINANAITEKYLGQEVTVWARFGQNSVKITGTLLGTRGGLML